MKEKNEHVTDDASLEKMFADYKPDMKSGQLFMSRLQSSMKSVEPVKERLDADRRVNRIAVAAAAVAGFIFGILVAVFYPLISDAVTSLTQAIKFINVQSAVTPLTWSLISLTGMLLVYFTYDVVKMVTQRR